MITIAITTLSRPAVAITLRDPDGDLSIQLDVADARICVIRPLEARVASDCDGIHVSAIDTALRAEGVPNSGFAIVVFKDHNVLVSLHTRLGATPVTAEEISSFVAGTHDRMVKILGPSAHMHEADSARAYDLIKVNGVDVVATLTEGAIPPNDPKYGISRALSYALMGRNGVSFLVFMGDPEHVAGMRALANDVLRTVTVPPADEEGFGRSLYYLAGKFIALVGIPAVTAIVGVVVLVLARVRRKPTS